jgi:ribosomal protein S18 acetylase RimI-like enzyme
VARFAEAADVIAEAFVADPRMDWFFSDVSAPRRSTIRAQFTYLSTRHGARGWPIRGVEVDHRLAGVGFFIPPTTGSLEPDSEIEAAYGCFRALITEGAESRLSRYGEWCESLALPDPHVYVMTLGIRPAFRGGGIGRLLVHHAVRLSDAVPESCGVGLDTENEANLDWYRRLGFSVTAEGRLDDLRLWSLFRHRSGPSSTRGPAA